MNAKPKEYRTAVTRISFELGLAMLYVGCFQARISYGMVILERVLGHVDRFQEHVCELHRTNVSNCSGLTDQNTHSSHLR